MPELRGDQRLLVSEHAAKNSCGAGKKIAVVVVVWSFLAVVGGGRG